MTTTGKRYDGFTGSRLIAVGAVLATFAALTGCKTDTVSTTPDKPTTAPKGAPAAKKPAAAAHIGSAVTIKGTNDGSQLTVTVLKVVDPARGADAYTSPSAGKKFVAVQFLLVNSGTIAYDDSPSNGSKIVDSEDQQYDTTFSEVSAGPSLNSTKIAVGGRAKGFLVYEVPKAAKMTAVQFGMDSGFSNTAEWKLK